MAEPSWRPCWFDSSETGAPVLNNVAGSLLDVLRSCLISGFNPRAVTSIVVASGVATATAAAHGYSAAFGKLLLIEGAPDAGLNGRVQPLSVTTNNFTYACPGVADGTYTGTITAKRAPLGWTEAHTGTNGAIFARSVPEASGSMLRVLDTRAAPAAVMYARVTMVATATDFDTYTDERPSDTTNPFWPTGNNDSASKTWRVVGDEKRIWLLLPASTTVGATGNLYFFGDPNPLYPGDAGGCVLVTHGATSSVLGGFGGTNIGSFTASTLNAHVVAHRALNNATGAITCGVCGPVGWGNAGASGDVAVPITSDYYIRTSAEIRSRLPGLFIPQGNLAFSNTTIYDFAGLDRKLLCLNLRTVASGAAGQVMLDVTGPWD